MAGPLATSKVIELHGRGPAPFAGMVLADLGAEVVSVRRVSEVAPPPHPPDAAEDEFTRLLLGHRRHDLVERGKRSIALDLRHPLGRATLLDLVGQADVVLEGFRPGVMERLRVGPEVCLERNPRLIYGRVTGWGRDGPLGPRAGHDIDYVAVAGALEHLRWPDRPPMPPLNLLGDYAGGALPLVIGVLAALVERARSGRGQVVDAAMVDGAALLTTLFHGLRADGLWHDEPQGNVLDLGAPHYNVYETADGRYMAVGAGEPPFYRTLLRVLGLPEDMADRQGDRASWPADRATLAAVFRTRTQAEWTALLEGVDACAAPVLSFDEAPRHPHLAARRTFVEVDGVRQPAPTPRFGRSAPDAPGPPPVPGADTVTTLQRWGIDEDRIRTLLVEGAAAGAPPGSG